MLEGNVIKENKEIILEGSLLKEKPADLEKFPMHANKGTFEVFPGNQNTGAYMMIGGLCLAGAIGGCIAYCFKDDISGIGHLCW